MFAACIPSCSLSRRNVKPPCKSVCVNPLSYLQQKIYLRIKGFVIERYRDPLDKMHYGQNKKYTLTIK